MVLQLNAMVRQSAELPGKPRHRSCEDPRQAAAVPSGWVCKSFDMYWQRSPEGRRSGCGESLNAVKQGRDLKVVKQDPRSILRDGTAQADTSGACGLSWFTCLVAGLS